MSSNIIFEKIETCKRICGIYKIVNVRTGDLYVGQSVHMNKRWIRHQSNLRLGRHFGKLLQADYDKYGPDAFQCIVIEECSREDLTDLETYWFDTLHPRYNLMRPTDSGMLGKKQTAEHIAKRVASFRGYKMSDETKEKLRRANLGKKRPRNGKPFSEAEKAHHIALSESRRGQPSHNKGKTLSSETREKLRQANLGKHHTEEAKANMRGKHPSEETLAKMSAAQKGRSPSEETRRKISEAQKGEKGNNYGKPAYNRGVPHTEETRAKLREAHRRRRELKASQNS